MTRRTRLPVSAYLRPCPDCNASFVGRGLTHEDTCPLSNGIEDTCADDRQWFLDNPEETVRIRPATHAELLELAHHTPGLPRPNLVHVHNYAWGRTRVFVTGGDDQLLVLDKDG